MYAYIVVYKYDQIEKEMIWISKESMQAATQNIIKTISEEECAEVVSIKKSDAIIWIDE